MTTPETIAPSTPDTHAPFTRTAEISPGHFVTAELSPSGRGQGHKLSITAVTPRSAGQCSESIAALETFTPGWDAGMRDRLLAIWEAYHLNDMQAGCPHQTGPDWDTSARIAFEFVSIHADDHRELTRQATRDGNARARSILWMLDQHKINPWRWVPMTPAILADLERDRVPLHPEATHHAYRDLRAKHQNDGRVYQVRPVALMLRTKTESAGWTRHTEHPAGLLMKPCATCGYQYGSQWLQIDVPADAVEFLRTMPTGSETDDPNACPYDVQAERFLNTYGINFHAEHVREKAPTWGGSKEQHHRITLTLRASDKILGTVRGRLSFDFWNSQHDTEHKIALRPYSVLASLGSDLSYHGQTPDDIAADMGLKPSHARAVVAFSRRLHRFFSKAGAVDALQAIQ